MTANKKILWGSLFFMLSGVIYEIERILSYFKWAVLTIPVLNKGTGGFSTQPDQITFSNNIFISLFFVIGIFFFILAGLPLLRKRNKKDKSTSIR